MLIVLYSKTNGVMLNRPTDFLNNSRVSDSVITVVILFADGQETGDAVNEPGEQREA